MTEEKELPKKFVDFLANLGEKSDDLIELFVEGASIIRMRHDAETKRQLAAEREAKSLRDAAEAVALHLVPPSVRKYCEFELTGANQALLWIAIPGAAVLEAAVSIRFAKDEEPMASFVKYERAENGWRIRQHVYNDEFDIIALVTKDVEPSLPVALARAVALGDGKEVAEAAKSLAEEAEARKQRDQKPDPAAPFCPLKADGERCRGQHCAWWHADHKACSILVLAASKA